MACDCGFLIAVMVVATQKECNTKYATSYQFLAALSLALSKREQALTGAA